MLDMVGYFIFAGIFSFVFLGIATLIAGGNKFDVAKMERNGDLYGFKLFLTLAALSWTWALLFVATIGFFIYYMGKTIWLGVKIFKGDFSD